MSIKDFVISKINHIYDQDDEMSEEIIGDIVHNVISEYGVKCNYFNAGDFTSTGYDCYYYVIAFIDENGNLEGVDVQVESY